MPKKKRNQEDPEELVFQEGETGEIMEEVGDVVYNYDDEDPDLRELLVSEEQSQEGSETKSETRSDVLEFTQSNIRIEPKALEDPQDEVTARFKGNIEFATVRNATLDLEFRKGKSPFVLEGGRAARLSRSLWEGALKDCGCFELSEQGPQLRRS